MPDMVGILFNRAVRREVAHIGDIQHRFIGPLLRMTVQLIHLILTIHVATVIRQNLIVVAEVNQRIQQVTVASRLRWAEQAGADLRQRLVQLFILLIVITRFVAVSPQGFNLFRRITEDKEIIRPDVLLHLNVSPVQGTDG